MAYTLLKMDPAKVKRRTAQVKKTLKAKGKDDLIKQACEVFTENFHGDYRRYRDFGPYWWAVKEILIKRGYAFGETRNPEIAREYCGETDEETVIAAEMFQNYYLSTYFLYTNTFQLDEDDPEEWTLWDPDYEEAWLGENLDEILAKM